MLFLKNIALCVLSAGLLVISYPQIEWWPLAWVALVPWLWAIEGKSARAAFALSYGTGFIFFGGTVGWLVYVTYPGAFLMAAFLALYVALFGLAFHYFRKLPTTPRVFVLAATWVCLEFIRSNLFTGFGWVTLGHSQYKNLFLIQIADITGVYGVSFLVMLVNLLVFETLKSGSDIASIRKIQILTCVLLVAALGYGLWTVSRGTPSSSVNIGIVQPNVAQSIKWEPQLRDVIVRKHIGLSRLLQGQNLDMIVWPETAMPGITWESPALLEEIRQTAIQLKTAILFGAITEENSHYFNSALAFSRDGVLTGRYDKIHLVPFGEYLPLRPWLGWINQFVALDDFTSGKEYTLLEAGCPQKAFATLICFEDTLSYLRRNFTNAGAKFFVNMTNDAWFQDTKAPFLHLQAAVLGCVENKRALVRSANTGVSVLIDPFGRMVSAVQDPHGKKTFISGVASARLPLMEGKTVYTKYGDIFTYLCFACILWGIAIRRRYA